MKQKIVRTLLIIISIILVSGLILYYKKHNTDIFPHYKQAYYKMEGSMYVIKDNKFDLPLIFVDSNEASEMSTSDNIKSIEIIDANAQNLNITGWHIDNNIKTSDFIFRSIQTEAILDYEGVFIPKEIIITYKDNVSKRYDFGDFKIISYSNDYYSDNLIAGVVCNIISIPSNNRDVYPYSGLVVFIKGYTEEISIEKIDL